MIDGKMADAPAVAPRAPKVGSLRHKRHPADWVFAAALITAIPVLRYANRTQWFAADEWALLLDKHLTDPGSMIERQNGHITTLPAVLYRLLYAAFAFHHYWPYQALAIAAHLGIVALLWIVMLRAGVQRWIATVAAVVFLFFGAGGQNMATGFQITQTGAVLFGLLMLLGCDHDGPLDRRDAWAVGAGLAAVACSAAAVPMIGVVGLAVLARRGWRLAAVVVAGPAALFVAWNALVPTADPPGEPGGLTSMIRFARDLWFATFEAIGQFAIVGWALLVVLVAGWALAVHSVRTGAVSRDRLVAPAALLVGALGMALFIGRIRSAPTPWGVAPVALSRYLYLIAALALPALAVAIGELARRWRPAAAGALVLLLIGLPGNVQKLGPSPENAEWGDEATVLQVADLAVDMDPPYDMKPLLWKGSGLRFTVGPLREARIAGDVPDPLPGTEAQRQYAFLALLFNGSTDVATVGCTEVRHGEPLAVQRNDLLVIDSPRSIQIQRVVDGAPEGAAYIPVSFQRPSALRVTWGPAEIAISAGPAAVIYHCASP